MRQITYLNKSINNIYKSSPRDVDEGLLGL